MSAVTLCKMCGRKITDPASVERKIGSSCWAKLHPKKAKKVKKQSKKKRGKRKGKAVKEWKQELLPFEEVT